MRSDDCFVPPYTAEYGFCKPFDPHAAEVQVMLGAIKVQENYSVSFYGTIQSCVYDFKSRTWKRHASWLLVKARAADTLVELDYRRSCCRRLHLSLVMLELDRATHDLTGIDKRGKWIVCCMDRL